MKNLFGKLLIIATVLITLSSCEKETIYPSQTYPTFKPESYYLWENDSTKYISLWGKFLIIDAVMYVDNHETGKKTKYNHFDATKNTSSMRWGGSMFDIETIIRDSTTYSFYKPLNIPGTGKFVLNGDTTKHYGVHIIGWNKAIVEDPVHGMTQQMLGGSSRPFSGQILNYNDKTVVMQIQEMEGSIDGYNCRYWTQLTLRKIEEW